MYSGGARLRVKLGNVNRLRRERRNATDNTPHDIDFQAQMLQATTETVTLRNFTVVRYPAQWGSSICRDP